jgi:hypothetical protein
MQSMLKLITRRRRRLAPRNPSGLVVRAPEPMPRMRWY